MHRLGVFFARAASAALLFAVCGGLTALGEAPNRRFPANMGHGPSQKSPDKPAGQDYKIIPIPLPPDAIGSYGITINNRRTVVGQIIYPTGMESTFVFSGGNLEVIAHPDEPFTGVASVSDSDSLLFGNWGGVDRQYAGTYDRRTRAFTALPDIPGKPINIGQQSNDAGVALGYACEGTLFAPVNCVYWLHRNGAYEFLALPPLNDLVLRYINNRGQISGQYQLAPPFDYRAFVYEKGAIRDLPITQDAAAFGINNQGQMLLNCEFSTTDFFRPALYDRGTVVRLPDAPNTFSTVWFGLNERGDLAGGATPDLFSPPAAYVAYRK